MKLRSRLWPIVLLVTLATSHAWSEEFMPARFGDHERSISNTLLVPYGRPPGAYDVSVTCQVVVEPDGSTSNPHCLADVRYDAFQREVMAAIAGAVMEPATIDGEPVRVLMSFMAGYRCLEICSILLLENHARHVAELGFAYSTPQPVLNGDEWYQGFEEKLAWAASGRGADEAGGIKFIVSTVVDTRGKSSRRRVVARSAGFGAAAARAARSLDDVRYIPGFQEGQPLELGLYEYWLDPDGTPPELISLPVRVHLLVSEFVPKLESGLTEANVQGLFDEVNAHWRPAGIRWDIESVVEVDAERQLAFRRITENLAEIDFSDQAYDVFSRLCPREAWLQDGWNVCFVGEFPWVATHFGEGFVVAGEIDARGERVQAFALARELGETLGALEAPRCTSRYLVDGGDPDGAFEGPCATTHIDNFEIGITRRQAAKGKPACPRRLRRGTYGGNWMLCLLQAAPDEHVRTFVPLPGTAGRQPRSDHLNE